MKQDILSGGYIKSERKEHPLYKKISEQGHNISKELKDNKMKLYFVLDRFIYRNEKGEIEFDSGFYQKTYDLDFSNNPDDFFLQYSLRLMSLHTLIMRKPLPFVAIGIWKKNWTIYPIMENISERLESNLFGLRDKWEFLINDIEIIEKNIKFHSSFQKALIWYTLAELSQTRLETFMNYYRFIEILSKEMYKHVEEKINMFIKTELYMFDEQEIKNKYRIPNREKINSYLKSQHVEHNKIQKIIEFRNMISHGDDYTLEFNGNLVTAIHEMEEIISIIIKRKIKQMGVKGLRNESFLLDYVVLIWESDRKIVLTDIDNTDLYRLPKKWNSLGWIGKNDDNEKLIEQIQGMVKSHGITDKQIYRNLIKNFGQKISY
ncbi:MAG: HEPN domain-containing protein (plasmid) [Candidatus Methanoperedens sp.]|uniref:HEPN domain-containing protein n=1 Tax=Candidatus Methanoperedens sp. BLZ2 TaxID=2035255 RepID=UPI000BE35A37|nr:HEPN domain-containing protein [Candidatus Methanoperedens sp. BLZ2]KAB2946421.1 MAG: hypothetical protein F9K14_07500 [Candidatus Methanoperedens sp.]MBZ0175657.1 hypothetical protein [Candidatus Methanoperedens nitroreducens]WAH95072.1 MAG: HEPN domain-containing protein [Candidatus Methanoperedens sp.]WAM22206.1 MAG: HEPN domain-containing protein [Candidatus Methanoperedens sp.]